MLARYRVASLAAIASLALAIGASTAAFLLIDALLSYRPLPVRAPHELFDLTPACSPPFMSPNNQSREFDMFSYPQFRLLRDVARDSADLFMTDWSGGLSSRGVRRLRWRGRKHQSLVFSGESNLDHLGRQARLGRLIQPDDDSSDGRSHGRRARLSILEAAFRRQSLRHRA